MHRHLHFNSQIFPVKWNGHRNRPEGRRREALFKKTKGSFDFLFAIQDSKLEISLSRREKGL